MTAQKPADVPVEPFSVGNYDAVESLLFAPVRVQLYDFLVCHNVLKTLKIDVG